MNEAIDLEIDASIINRVRECKFLGTVIDENPWGGLPYENDGDARQKTRIKPLKETNLGMVQALFNP